MKRARATSSRVLDDQELLLPLAPVQSARRRIPRAASRIRQSKRSLATMCMFSLLGYTQLSRVKRTFWTSIRVGASWILTCPPLDEPMDQDYSHLDHLTFGVAFVHAPDHDPSTGSGRVWESPQNQQLADLSMDNRLAYANHHNYTLINGTDWAVANYERCRHNLKWTKILYIQSVLHDAAYAHLDWILYLDTDLVILNMDMPLTMLLRGAQLASDALVVTMDADYINSGAFMIANTPAGRAVIDTWAMGHDKKSRSRHNQPMADQEYLERIFDAKTQALWQPPLNVVNLPKHICYHVVHPCILQSCGGLEYSRRLHKLFWDGFYVPGNFAVHFFLRPDKLEQMQLAASGSLGFFS